MNSLTSICYVCLKTKDKSLININSSLSVHKDILHILGYLPCNLAWLKTEQIVLICEECCRRLRETYLFFAMCRTNSAVLRGYMSKLNTASESNADLNSEIKLETEAVIKQEIVNALVNVIKIEDPWEELDDEEESLMDNKSIKNGSGQLWYPKYWSSSASVIVPHGKKRTKADNTSGGSGRAKKSKDTKGTASKECAVAEREMRAGQSAKQVLTKKAYKRYLKDVAEYARWMKPQEQQQQQEQQQKAQQQQQKGQKKELKKQKKLRKAKRRVFRKLLSRAKLHVNSTYEDFVKEYGQDERFLRVASPEDQFQVHINKLRKRELKQQQQQEQQQQQLEEQQQQQVQQQQQLEQPQQQEQQQQQLEQQQQQQQEQQQQLKQQQQEQEERNSKNIDFRKLLSEANLHGNSQYRDFAKEYGQDERFLGVAKRASRTGLFREYVNQVRKCEQKAKKPQRQNHVSDFTELQQINEGSC